VEDGLLLLQPDILDSGDPAAMTQPSDQGSVGASQQGPNDASSDFSKSAFLVRQMIAQMIDTMSPAQVTAVHPGSGSPPAAGTVDVQLLVSQIDGNGNVVQQGTVYGIPYFRLQGGAWAVVVDPAVGDFGYVIAASRDISSVVKNPGIQAPGSQRKYNFADGIFVGGALNTVPTATVWLKSDGTVVITDQNQNVIETTSDGITLTPAGIGVTINGNLIVNGALQLGGALQSVSGGTYSDTIATTGDVMAGSISVKLHTHGGVSSGTSNTGPPVG
jgi:hypothetical protein